ncbi:MAG: hypothetical protein GZ091_15910 [Paludibacter sp.]|nr:hypothetical protein [Paludibacter sp.]
MSIPQNFSESNINSFLPAILRENKSGWIIEYYCKNPLNHTLTRKQIKLQRIVKRYKSVKDARHHINRIVVALNAKLSGGWKSVFNSGNAHLYEKFAIVTELFLTEKRKENRENTIRSYASSCYNTLFQLIRVE